MPQFQSDQDQPRSLVGTCDERCRCGSSFCDHYNGQCPPNPNDAKPEDWYSTGQPFPWKPADGQW